MIRPKLPAPEVTCLCLAEILTYLFIYTAEWYKTYHLLIYQQYFIDAYFAEWFEVIINFDGNMQQWPGEKKIGHFPFEAMKNHHDLFITWRVLFLDSIGFEWIWLGLIALY